MSDLNRDFIKHIREKYAKAEADILIDELKDEAEIGNLPKKYLAENKYNFGGGGLGGDKSTYEWWKDDTKEDTLMDKAVRMFHNEPDKK